MWRSCVRFRLGLLSSSSCWGSACGCGRSRGGAFTSVVLVAGSVDIRECACPLNVCVCLSKHVGSRGGVSFGINVCARASERAAQKTYTNTGSLLHKRAAPELHMFQNAYADAWGVFSNHVCPQSCGFLGSTYAHSVGCACQNLRAHSGRC